MKALIYKGVKQFGIEQTPEPALPNPNWVKVQVKAAGLCGSDIHKLFYERPKLGYLNTQILGHELAGTIVECGSMVINCKVGDRVAIEPLIPCNKCNFCENGSYHLCPNIRCIGRDFDGGFAEFICCPQSSLYLIPSNMSFIEGAMIDPVAVAVHCINLVKPNKKRWNVAIIGDGPLGLICLQLTKALGANYVALFGKHDHNLQVAIGLGATKIIPSHQVSREAKEFNSFFDVVIEAVGGRQSETLTLCTRLVTQGGTIGVLGVYDFAFSGFVPFRELFQKEAKLLGLNSYALWNRKREFEIALESIENGLVDVKPLISRVYPLSDFEEGANTVRRKDEIDVIKIIFEP